MYMYVDIIVRLSPLLEQTVTQSEVEAPAASATGDSTEGQSTSASVTPSTSSSSVTREVTPVTTVSGVRDSTMTSSVREGQSLGKRTRDEAEGYENLFLNLGTLSSLLKSRNVIFSS